MVGWRQRRHVHMGRKNGTAVRRQKRLHRERRRRGRILKQPGSV
jgi:hypothetical protein